MPPPGKDEWHQPAVDSDFTNGERAAPRLARGKADPQKSESPVSFAHHTVDLDPHAELAAHVFREEAGRAPLIPEHVDRDSPAHRHDQKEQGTDGSQDWPASKPRPPAHGSMLADALGRGDL